MDAYFREIQRVYERHPIPPPAMSVLADHIDHAVRMAGIDHVGIGSDFGGISAMPEGMSGCQDLPMVTYHLLQRGYSGTDVEKILGRNFLRYLREVERTSPPGCNGPFRPPSGRAIAGFCRRSGRRCSLSPPGC